MGLKDHDWGVTPFFLLSFFRRHAQLETLDQKATNGQQRPTQGPFPDRPDEIVHLCQWTMIMDRSVFDLFFSGIRVLRLCFPEPEADDFREWCRVPGRCSIEVLEPTGAPVILCDPRLRCGSTRQIEGTT